MNTFTNSFVNTLTNIGFIILIIMGLLYLIPPIIKHIFKHSPPGIITLTYTLLTAFALILSIFLIKEKSFLSVLNGISTLIFIEGKVETQMKIMIVAFFISFFFLLSNLLRSYFNLHRIEEVEEDDGFACFLKTLKRKKRWVEFVLRAPIFIIIIFVELKVVSLNYVIESNTPLMASISNFRDTFKEIWEFAIFYYLILLIWDLFLLHEMGQSEESVRHVIKWNALPVHICGAIVAVSLTFASCFTDYANVFTPIALLISIIGITFIFVSLRDDWKLIWKSFRPSVSK